MTRAGTPHHCPFCGEENLWPFEAGKLAPQQAPHVGEQGAWECRSCLRAFKVDMIGHLKRPPLGGDR